MVCKNPSLNGKGKMRRKKTGPYKKKMKSGTIEGNLQIRNG